MRALMVPQIAGGEVASESDYYSHQTIMRAVSEIERSHFYVWLASNQQGRMKPVPDRTFFYEDCIHAFLPQMASAAGRIVELFSRQSGSYPVDCVFSSRAGMAPVLAIALACQTGPAVPVVITEPRVYWIGSETAHNVVSFEDTVLRAAGYASCLAIYWSSWEKKEALDAASILLASSVLKHADEYGFVVDPLVDVEPVKQPLLVKQKRLLFAGRLNENKRYKDVLVAYGKVLMSRKDVEVWIHSGTGAYDKLDAADSRWHRTSEKLPREDYGRLLAGSQVGAYLSRDEGANITVLEMLLSGLVMALPKRPWVEKLFWPQVYPFAVPDGQIPAMLDWLLDNYEEAWRQLEPIRQMIVERNSWPAFKRKMQKVLEAIPQWPETRTYHVFRKIVLQMMEHQNRRSLSFDVLMQATNDWRQWPVGMKSSYACYQAVRDMDDLSDGVPNLVASDEDMEWLKRQRKSAEVVSGG